MKKASTVVVKVDFEESSMRKSMKPGSRDIAARLESDGGRFYLSGSRISGRAVL